MTLVLCTREEAGERCLMHYRTPGSKNGERRYQNPDGSLTPEGYQHYKEMYGWGEQEQDGRSTPDSGGTSKGSYDDERQEAETRRQFDTEMRKLEKLDTKSNVSKQRKEANKYDLIAKKNLENVVSRTASAGLMTMLAGTDFVKGLAMPLASGGMAAYSKIRSQMAKQRMTDVGHAKAVAKYNQQFDKMIDMFKDTPYADLLGQKHSRKSA